MSEKGRERKKLILGGLLIVGVAATALTGGSPGDQFTLGIALGRGFVEGPGGETVALQYRLEFSKEAIYLALRGSWIAEVCQKSPNPKELSLLAGVSIPFASGRVCFNAGLGVGLAYIHGDAFKARTCEMRIKMGALGLTAFWNFNNRCEFHAICASVDFPLRTRR